MDLRSVATLLFSSVGIGLALVALITYLKYDEHMTQVVFWFGG